MIFVVAVFLFIHLSFYLFIFSKLAVYKTPVTIDEKAKPSIVVCYHNEEENVDRFLPAILNQAYSDLVLVNDHSSDKTLDGLNQMASEKVNIISIEEDSSGKKKALSAGIQAAKHNRVLLTDADCKPNSSKWSLLMGSQKGSFVLGYGPMNKGRGRVAEFSRFETYMTALQYLSYALAGIPYMGVGRNLLIDKGVVQKQKDKIQGSHLASGDDDLMINALANKHNTVICIDPDSFMYSDPKTTLNSFLVQKTRHIGTSPYYKPLHKILLTLFSFSQIIFYLGITFGLIQGTISLKIALMFVLAKWGIQQVIHFQVVQKLREDGLLWKMPFLDVLYFIYLLVLPFYFLINKNNSRWS